MPTTPPGARSLSWEQVAGACVSARVQRLGPELTVNLSVEGCRGTRRGLLAATPLHSGSTDSSAKELKRLVDETINRK